MKIENNSLNDLHKVIEGSNEHGDFYLSSEVVEYLKSKGQLESLEDLSFYSVPETGDWEISAHPPSGVPGQIASVIFAVSGKFYLQDDKIICRLLD